MNLTYTDDFSFIAVSTETARNNFPTSITKCEKNELYRPSVTLGMRKIKKNVRLWQHGY